MSTTLIFSNGARMEIAVPGFKPQLSAQVVAYIERPAPGFDLYTGKNRAERLMGGKLFQNKSLGETGAG